LGSEVAANDAHVYEARHSFLLICRDVDHGSRTNRKPSRKDRLAGLAFRIERNSGGLRGKRTSEKTLCTGVAMRHEVRLSKPKRIIWIICGTSEEKAAEKMGRTH
jgi:hypothetical protein